MITFSARHFAILVVTILLIIGWLQSNNNLAKPRESRDRIGPPHLSYAEQAYFNVEREQESQLFYSNVLNRKTREKIPYPIKPTLPPKYETRPLPIRTENTEVVSNVIPKPNQVIELSIFSSLPTFTKQDKQTYRQTIEQPPTYQPLPNQFSNQNEWTPPTRDVANPPPEYIELQRLRCASEAVNRWSHQAAISHPAYRESLLVCEYPSYATVAVAWQTNDLCSRPLTLPTRGRISDTRILTNSPTIDVDQLVLVLEDQAQHLSCQLGDWVVETKGARRDF